MPLPSSNLKDLPPAVARAFEKWSAFLREKIVTLYKIFKDADALDRWRLGHDGLDEAYLRNDEAGELVDFSRKLVEEMGK